MTHSTTRLSPFQVAYRKPPHTIPWYFRGTSQLEAIGSMFTIREEIFQKLQQNLYKTQQLVK